MNTFKLKLIISLFLIICCSANDRWAILIAGSNTWFNYRHQADVLHAYQVLIQKNFSPDKIIVFAYDDIANNTRNPFPGKIFNKPSFDEPGVDVYAGVKIDYSGKDVNPTVFLNVLEGNKSAVNGIGSGRVLQSTKKDNIFMFFSDHGAPGLIAFPSVYLYADQLLATFAKMKGKYHKFVFYLETCESGSMFQKLPNDTMIYAVSAANPTQSSWGTYCSPNDVIQGKHVGTCLGDLFSVNFIQDSESKDVFKETLLQQYQQVKQLTKQSHVLPWGDVSYLNDTVATFIAGKQRNSDQQQKKPLKFKFNVAKAFEKINKLAIKRNGLIDSRMMKVKILSQIYARDKTAQSYLELRQEMRSMQRFDTTFSVFSHKLKLSGTYDSQKINFDCLRNTIDSFEKKCEKFSDYGLMYVKYLSQACQSHSAETINQQIHCSK